MKKLLLFISICLFFIVGCNKTPDKIKVDNKLNKSIICIIGYNYPDLKLGYINKQAIMADSDIFEVDSGQVKEIDTVGLCKKQNWNKYIQQSLVMLFVFDKYKYKFIHSKNIEDALIERYYFSYTQLLKTQGVIAVN